MQYRRALYFIITGRDADRVNGELRVCRRNFYALQPFLRYVTKIHTFGKLALNIDRARLFVEKSKAIIYNWLIFFYLYNI